MKILIAPDKFKGSLSAEEVCHAIQNGIKQFNPDFKTTLHPFADGGEGTLVILEKLLKLERVELKVQDPLFRPIISFYQKNQDTAFIEMATASGLLLLTEEERNCMHTTTFGTGQMILDAVQKGIKNIVLFIGGSATNDAGIGLAAALGFRFLRKNGEPISPVGKDLIDIDAVDQSQLEFDFSDIQVRVVCDVENVLYGKNGAAHVFGKQKGADENEIIMLDEGLRHFSQKIKEHLGKEIAELKGGGAAGGLGAGAVAFLDAKIQSGIQTILEVTNFEEKLAEVDLVITGEGKLDASTLQGKVVKGVANAAKERGIPTWAICGICEVGKEKLEKIGVAQVGTLVDGNTSIAQAIAQASNRTEEVAQQLLRSHFQ